MAVDQTALGTSFAAFFDTLTERAIRRRQALCKAQIVIAHTMRNEAALANLRTMERELTEAMLRKLA